MYMLTSASILTSVNSGFSHVMMSYLLFASHTLPYHNTLVQAQIAQKESSAGRQRQFRPSQYAEI